MKKIIMFLLILLCFALVACSEEPKPIDDPVKPDPIVDPDPKVDPEPVIDDKCDHVWNTVEGKKATCTTDGYTDYIECEYCHEVMGKEVIASPHKEHNLMKIKEVDASLQGTKKVLYRCKDCGEEVYEYVNPLGKSDEELQNLNVLLIGNSFTNYNTLKTCLQKVINSADIEVNIVKVAYGSQYLYDYIEGEKGDYYDKVVEATTETKFDVVFLQEQSNMPATNSPVFYDSTRTLCKYFEPFGTLPIMYETWSYKGGYSSRGWSEDEMGQRLCAAYQAIALEMGIPVSRAGSAIDTVLAERKDLILHNTDNQHPSALGTYIVALTHFATLYGRSPVGISYKYNDYLADADITWHTETGKTPIDDATQAYVEKVVEKIVFGDSIVKDRYKTSSVGVFDDPTKTQGFDNTVTMDKEVSTKTKAVTYKQNSGAWSVTTAEDGTQAFVNTSDKAVLMFQEELVPADSNEWHTLSFDVKLLKEVDNYTYARGVIMGCTTNAVKYFDGSDGIVIGRRCYNNTPAFQVMRVWNPSKYPLYHKDGNYTFDDGFEMQRIGSCFTGSELQHIQIVFNLAEQKYAIYLNGQLNAYVIGVDLTKGGYMGLYSFDSNRLQHSNFKLDGEQLIFTEKTN